MNNPRLSQHRFIIGILVQWERVAGTKVGNFTLIFGNEKFGKCICRSAKGYNIVVSTKLHVLSLANYR